MLGWDITEKPNKGIRYTIASYYFQAVIDDLQLKSTIQPSDFEMDAEDVTQNRKIKNC